jgi:Tol biopolymer transport system component
LTADGLIMYTMGGTGPNFDIYTTTRGSLQSPFATLSLVRELNTGLADDNPFVLPSGQAIYFSSDRGGNLDLYRAARSAASFNPPVIVAGADLATPGVEAQPVVSADELTLLFSSNRPGGVGASDVYIATRPSASVPFDAPQNLTAVNTIGDDAPSWLSADGCLLYLTQTVSQKTSCTTQCADGDPSGTLRP